MLIRREMLEKIGGIETIRGELIDDCALARAVKRNGGKAWLGLTWATRNIRAYGVFGVALPPLFGPAVTAPNSPPPLLPPPPPAPLPPHLPPPPSPPAYP